jgi:hypothetical protein
MTDWKQYRRTNIVEMREYEPGENLEGSVSISQPDRLCGNPKPGTWSHEIPKR